MAKRTTTFGIAATYIGTVIGAGFASGQEVLQYFVSFGPAGPAAIVLATLLFFGFGALAMLLGHHLQTDRYAPIMEWRGYRLPRLFADFFITLSLAGTFVIMVAGAGSTFAQAFGVPAFVGSIAVGVLCILNLLKGLDGLVRVQSILVPLLIAGAIGVATPMPWRIQLKWRTSTLAGFEGGTRIYVTTISPWELRDRALDALAAPDRRARLASGLRLGGKHPMPT